MRVPKKDTVTPPIWLFQSLKSFDILTAIFALGGQSESIIHKVFFDTLIESVDQLNQLATLNLAQSHKDTSCKVIV
jgi:hypothetical protein